MLCGIQSCVFYVYLKSLMETLIHIEYCITFFSVLTHNEWVKYSLEWVNAAESGNIWFPPAPGILFLKRQAARMSLTAQNMVLCLESIHGKQHCCVLFFTDIAWLCCFVLFLSKLSICSVFNAWSYISVEGIVKIFMHRVQGKRFEHGLGFR